MSNAHTFGVIDYGVFIGMLIVSSGIGVYYAWADRKKQTNDEFLMGGKRMGIIPVTLSLMASFMSPVSILGYPAEVYMRGPQMWLTVISCVICIIISAEIFLPIFYKLSLTSVNEYLFKRYNSNMVRKFASVTSLIAMLPYLGVVLFGPSLALSAVTNLSVTSCVFLMGFICTFYTSLGGLKAVIWTDVVQFILMFAGMMAVVIKGSIDAGGITEVFRKADAGSRLHFFNMRFDIYASSTFWTIVIGLTTLWTAGFSTNQMQVQRSCSMPNITKAKTSLYVSLPGFLVMLSLSCFAGIIAYANYYDCDPLLTGQMERPDQIMPLFVMQAFGDNLPGLPGLFVACVFSSSLSTLSSGYNAMAAIVWEDLLKNRFHAISDKRALWITKSVAAIIGIISVGVAFLVSTVGTIFEAAVALSGAQMGPLFALFALGVLCPFCNAIGVTIGLVAGQIVSLMITFGAIFHKRPFPEILPTSTEGCDAMLFPNITNKGIPLILLQNATIPQYFPEGLNRIYHISPYLVPVFGFIVSLTVGLIMSILTGGNKHQIDPNLINQKAYRIYEFFCCNKKQNIKQNEFPLKKRTYSGPIPMSAEYLRVPQNDHINVNVKYDNRNKINPSEDDHQYANVIRKYDLNTPLN